jgi:uncharacterized protein YifN (PemK superfamily)
VSRHAAGSIVVVDWRGGALPNEPSRLRLAVVVEEHELFPDEYPNMLVVPLTRDEGLAHRSFAERIEPTVGADATCWALAHHVTSVSPPDLSLPAQPPCAVTSLIVTGMRHQA